MKSHRPSGDVPVPHDAGHIVGIVQNALILLDFHQLFFQDVLLISMEVANRRGTGGVHRRRARLARPFVERALPGLDLSIPIAARDIEVLVGSARTFGSALILREFSDVSLVDVSFLGLFNFLASAHQSVFIVTPTSLGGCISLFGPGANSIVEFEAKTIEKGNNKTEIPKIKKKSLEIILPVNVSWSSRGSGSSWSSRGTGSASRTRLRSIGGGVVPDGLLP